jgi:ABC-type cobalamin/Fe3+-siderophores transport system ATPase subunit
MFRLKSLYIKDYKNIHDQKFDFSSNTGYIALIGLNGSGKSNLLEAISLIFDELYGIKHPEQDEVKGYRITYEIDGIVYTCTTLDGQNNIIQLDKEGKKYPSSVIACYSGEDLRLWEMAYKPYYKGFFYDALHGKDYVPQTMYINKYCWKIALVSLLFSLNRDVQQFVTNVLHIDVANVSVQFTYNEIANPQHHDAFNWLERIKQQYGTNDIPLEELRDFGLGNTLHKEMTEDLLVFFYLYFLHLPKKTPDQPIDKLISTISIKLGTFEFDALSEGEKKMILIACITKILGDENSLVLLDEPDAHVHIENKKKILETIVQHTGQTILTTHSPIFTTLMSSDNIFPIDKGNAVNESQRDLIIKMANNNINYIDGACIIASKYVIVTEGPDDIYHIKSAISAFAALDSKYKALENVSYVFTGGAKEVDKYYDEILKSLYDTITKMVFVFDYDREGREGAKMVQKLIDSGKAKLQYVFYHKTYPVPAPDVDFYLEDFFDRITYQDVQLPNINGVPSFAELKKAKTWAESIKKRIQRHRQENSLTPEDYNGFQEFLNQLILSFGF